jgi:hypothetical protein
MTSTNFELLLHEIHDVLEEDIATIDTSSTSQTAQTMLTKILEAPIPEYTIDAKSLRPQATRPRVRLRLVIVATSVAAVTAVSVLLSGVSLHPYLRQRFSSAKSPRSPTDSR